MIEKILRAIFVLAPDGDIVDAHLRDGVVPIGAIGVGGGRRGSGGD